MTASINRTTTLDLNVHLLHDAGFTLLPATLSYDMSDPYAVRMTFPTQNRTWVFSRTLLEDGFEGPTGDGDVKVLPSADDEDALRIELSSPSGHAVFEVDGDLVGDWLCEVHQIVPRDWEDVVAPIDWDALIRLCHGSYE